MPLQKVIKSQEEAGKLTEQLEKERRNEEEKRAERKQKEMINFWQCCNNLPKLFNHSLVLITCLEWDIHHHWHHHHHHHQLSHGHRCQDHLHMILLTQ